MERRVIRTFVAVATIAIAFAAHGQAPVSDLRVRLQDASGNPIGGALVALVDGDHILTENLSSERGSAKLSAPRGLYRIRVRRIGFRPYTSDPITLPSSNELLLRVESQQVVLDVMVVSAHTRCGKITSDAETLSAVWEEASKALRASELTLDDLHSIGQSLTYKSQLGAHGDVISSDTVLLPPSNRRPFAAPDPSSLSVLGYVRGDAANGWEYFAPDEAVLLSDDFAATHCFTVVRDTRKRAGQIGVAFEPAPQQRLSDIKGVLWVNEKTAELRDVGFKFVHAGILDRFDTGGFTRFRRMASGAWIVNEWKLRMPMLASPPGAVGDTIAVGYLENGGMITSGTTFLKPKR
jgi:hypothetical protein